MPNNYNSTSTIRMLKGRILVVRERFVFYNRPQEVIKFFRIMYPFFKTPTPRIFGKHVIYDKVGGCYHLDPTEITHPATYRGPFRLIAGSPIAKFARHVPCPKVQPRLDPEWRQGKWMKYLEHERGWREC